ncbi:TlpA disulfide reductase family protein [Pedobacter sp. MC2016-24]|uniref:TlpA disulfide reductase family protein n=1 Tax=Pedobacter sp. MC2016-24 TaxID=2780090 RepID=UPI00187FFD7F|nr:TlpA disulfide reductase family protein [Pedobacter sp. MC2016-24]MBE9603084.1 AhpC/TSA family protein [Pedobacter sp. MC2016-24]
MLKTLITAVIGLAALSANAQNEFVLSGKLKGNHEGKKVILSYPNPESKYAIKDSTFVKNGQFSFKGKVADVVRAELVMSAPGKEIDRSDWRRFEEMDLQSFFLENKKMNLTGANIKHAWITGGTVQRDYELLKTQLKPFEDKGRPLTKKYIQYVDEKNKTAMDALQPQLQAIGREQMKMKDDFFLKHPDSYVSLYILSDQGGIESPAFETRFNTLSSRIKNSDMGKRLRAGFNALKSVEVGKAAKDFVQNDTEGRPVTLSAFKGRYILLDFWASWCGPCRSENPNVLKAYQKFKGENFEIIAISLDDKKDPWLKAIQTDGLPWIQLSDLKGIKNQVAMMYGVTGIPQNFLIDPNGMIVARDLRGDALEKMLQKFIK